MKKIVIDVRMINHSGIGQYLQNLIPLLCDDNLFILLGDKNVIRGFSWADKVEIIHFNCPILSIQEQFLLPLAIPQCDIFWSPQYNVPLLPIRAKKRLLTIHDVFQLAFFDTLSLPQKIYARTVINLAVRLSDKVLTVSDFSKSEITRFTGVNPQKVQVIYNGIDRELFIHCENKKTLDEVSAKYKLPSKFILYVGNVKPHKNLNRLVKAVKEIWEEYKLVIVGKKDGFITGDKEFYEMINNEKDIKEHIIFTGIVDRKDLPVIYSLATLLTFPSLYEGFGFPPIEAMACGCPCVVSNTASIPEVCGDAAYYVDPYDIEDITKGIAKVLGDNDLRNNLRQKGNNRVELYNCKNIGAMIKMVIGELCQ